MSRYSTLCLAVCLCACVPPDDTTDDTDGSCSGGSTVELDDVSDVSEGATWEEDGVTLTLLASDQGQFNARAEPSTGCLWLYIGTVLRAEPSCLTATAEIDTTDYCGGGCAQAVAFEGTDEVATAASTAGNDPQTLVLDGAGANFDAVEVAGLETPVCEIRLTP